MKAATEYLQYGITKKRFQEILSAMLTSDSSELISVAALADELISSYLVESVRCNLSYEKLEQMHGILPVSKSDFYRKRRLMFHYMDLRMLDQVEGQMTIFDFPEYLPDGYKNLAQQMHNCALK